MDFQTPIWACEYMANMVTIEPESIIEPTPGEGNLLMTIKNKFPHASITAPNDFDIISDQKFDLLIANPPFTPMARGYELLERFIEISDYIIVLMPWLTLINSEKRTRKIVNAGLVEVVHLPRRTFKGSRVQTCIMKIVKGGFGQIRLNFL